MTKNGNSRREILAGAALGGAGMVLGNVAPAYSTTAAGVAAKGDAASVKLSWLGGKPPEMPVGVVWGVPWPRGGMPKGKSLVVSTASGQKIPTEHWPLAFWPDGSIKWSGVTVVGGPALSGPLSVGIGSAPAAPSAIRVKDSNASVEISTGPMTCRISRRGANLIDSLVVDGREVGKAGRLIVLREDRSEQRSKRVTREESFTSRIDKVTIEHAGAMRAVVKLEGMHSGSDSERSWLPFSVRLYFTAGVNSIRLVHSFVFDGDASVDFIKGLGIAFAVPFREERQNRHVRFAGDDDGFWGEPVMMSPGYRDSLVKDALKMNLAQLAGERIPNLNQLDAKTKAQFETVAVWDAFKLRQLGPDSYSIDKGTGPESSWLHVTNGLRARGFAFLGDVSGGLAVGVRHFWEKYPTALEITGASTPEAELKIWFWSPDAPAMDLRHYDTIGHDGKISYEDWQPGFSTPVGVANTSELTLWAMPSTPNDDLLIAASRTANAPPLLICEPQYYHSTQTLGVWSLPDRSTATGAKAEEQLDRAWNFFADEVEQRRWYGFWDFGDVIRTYDKRRHQWMYDIGGHAWNATELVPNMWLWFTFLRTGRADAFRFAEAMTRNTGEVDVYHAGRFKGLGSRHNVSHWGCGAKEARISAALLKRYYYYLTADDRTGDLMREVLTVDETVANVPPLRVAFPDRTKPVFLRVGPDWLAFASNWMTEWERTGDTRYRDYCLIGMKCIGAMPEAFTSRLAFRYDPKTKMLSDVGEPNLPAGEFLDLFGGDQIAMELIQLIDCPEFAAAWNLLCDKWAHANPGPGYTKMRITAYAATVAHDATLKDKAETLFRNSLVADGQDKFPAKLPVIQGARAPRPIRELVTANTPDMSQWAINLLMTGEFLRRFQPGSAPANPKV